MWPRSSRSASTAATPSRWCADRHPARVVNFNGKDHDCQPDHDLVIGRGCSADFVADWVTLFHFPKLQHIYVDCTLFDGSKAPGLHALTWCGMWERRPEFQTIHFSPRAWVDNGSPSDAANALCATDAQHALLMKCFGPVVK